MHTCTHAHMYTPHVHVRMCTHIHACMYTHITDPFLLPYLHPYLPLPPPLPPPPPPPPTSPLPSLPTSSPYLPPTFSPHLLPLPPPTFSPHLLPLPPLPTSSPYLFPLKEWADILKQYEKKNIYLGRYREIINGCGQNYLTNFLHVPWVFIRALVVSLFSLLVRNSKLVVASTGT